VVHVPNLPEGAQQGTRIPPPRPSPPNATAGSSATSSRTPPSLRC